MQKRGSIEELKELGAGRTAPDDVARLYHQAFREFGAMALWSRRASEHAVRRGGYWPSSAEIGGAMLDRDP
jgi:hypothetical protein